MNKKYKYSLDTSSKKFICPYCNKKTFVKFIDNETKTYLNNINGRCDRESKCGYFKKPNNNTIINNNDNFITEVLQPTYHKPTVLQHFCNTKKQNNFVTYLFSRFDKKDVLKAINMYHIGSTNYWNKATIFWQIDQNNIIRGGKIMQYNSNTGKRVKEPFSHISWIHKQLKLHNFVLQQCLFGLHILKSTNETICIVESEKTAIIMSIMLPNFKWLATGSRNGFKEEILNPIKKYKVIAYPDKSEFQKWSKTVQLLKSKSYNIECSNLLENIDLENGGDLVDLLSINKKN